MKIIIFSIGIFFLLLSTGTAQNDVMVTVKGVGLDRAGAINDARRRAVEKGLGTFIHTETEVKDMVAISDAISTTSSGWVTWDSIINETKLSSTYEVEMMARVSSVVLEKDVKTLAQWLGGLQFLVFYDPSKVIEEDLSFYEYAYERLNYKLKEKEYRYIEKSLFDNFVQTEKVASLENDSSEFSYQQKLGASVKSEFIIYIEKLEIRNVGSEVTPVWQVTMQVKAYDNCTAEGFSSVVMQGQSQNPDKITAVRYSIETAINTGVEALLYQFNKYMGTWVNTGANFKLRFYDIDYEDLRPLKNKIKSDPDFGEQLSINDYDEGYSDWYLTFKKKPDELLDFVLDNCSVVKKSKIYGRYISFKPRQKSNNTQRNQNQ